MKPSAESAQGRRCAGVKRAADERRKEEEDELARRRSSRIAREQHFVRYIGPELRRRLRIRPKMLLR